MKITVHYTLNKVPERLIPKLVGAARELGFYGQDEDVIEKLLEARGMIWFWEFAGVKPDEVMKS